ncbi:MAG: hypothetical protein Q9M08_03480, partial [Mariprofundus sp.]|nr:hypothetical protein [Mariprofundus sp.]
MTAGKLKPDGEAGFRWSTSLRQNTDICPLAGTGATTGLLSACSTGLSAHNPATVEHPDKISSPGSSRDKKQARDVCGQL